MMHRFTDIPLYDSLDAIGDALRGCVLTIGNFDGVHLGHHRNLRTAHAIAAISKGPVVVMTFDPHPLDLLRPEHVPPKLTPWPEKHRLLAAAGTDAIVRLPTTSELLAISAESFVRDILAARIGPSHLIEGPDFGFGRGRQGNVDLLARLAPECGYELRIVEPYKLHAADGTPTIVSSTAIRAALAAGNVEQAAACLGRPYALIGTVIHGAGAGTHLGYPTINLNVADQLIPGEGVYAGWAEVGGEGEGCRVEGSGNRVEGVGCRVQGVREDRVAHPSRSEGWGHDEGHKKDARHPAAISIGHRPTLGGTSLVVEGFVLDAAGEWYGRPARLELTHRIRDQVRFPSREALTEQIRRDVEAVRRLAGTTG